MVKSLDGATVVALPNVKTVSQMQISKSCVPKQVDLHKLSHLHGINIPELKYSNVMLIGLKERPRLFLPLEYREGGEDEPIVIRYSLGWTTKGTIGGQKEDEDRNCSVNFTRTKKETIVLKMNESRNPGYAEGHLQKGEDLHPRGSGRGWLQSGPTMNYLYVDEDCQTEAKWTKDCGILTSTIHW